MKLVSFAIEGHHRAGLVVDDQLYPLISAAPQLPPTLLEILQMEEAGMDVLNDVHKSIKKNPSNYNSYPLKNQQLLAPIPNPTSCRDAYAFRQHVSTARRNRGAEMIPEFDQFPVFYFTNHNAVYGPGELELMPDHFLKLDFELEVAVVIGKRGRNIRAEDADDYIAGYTIMNDMSARELQMQEMKLNLGPAKGKDFATIIGPYLITKDELLDRRVETKPEHTGEQYDLKMRAFHNGKQVSEGNLAQMDWTFAEIIERVSYGVDIFPGDVIGSGTVGTGCYLELNGTARVNNPDAQAVWIEPGDELKLEVDGLGALHNKVKIADTKYSLLALKHNAS